MFIQDVNLIKYCARQDNIAHGLAAGFTDGLELVEINTMQRHLAATPYTCEGQMQTVKHHGAVWQVVSWSWWARWAMSA